MKMMILQRSRQVEPEVLQAAHFLQAVVDTLPALAVNAATACASQLQRLCGKYDRCGRLSDIDTCFQAQLLLGMRRTMRRRRMTMPMASLMMMTKMTRMLLRTMRTYCKPLARRQPARARRGAQETTASSG